MDSYQVNHSERCDIVPWETIKIGNTYKQIWYKTLRIYWYFLVM